MHDFTVFDGFYVYGGLAILLYLITYFDLPPHPSMKRSEGVKFLLMTPVIWIMFIVASPVIGGMFIRVVWNWWRDTCAFRRISEKNEPEDTSKGTDRL